VQGGDLKAYWRQVSVYRTKGGYGCGREESGELQAVIEERQLSWERDKGPLCSSKPLRLRELGSLPSGFLKADCSVASAWTHMLCLALVAVVAPQGSVTQKGSINYVSLAKEERQ
jgi:hypothetical protein